MRRIDNPRLLAFEALAEVELKGEYSNIILPRMLGESSLERSDRALVSELVYGSLRMKGRHDEYIRAVSTRELSDIDEKAIIVLRLGVHQLKQMRVPSHAAIYESVELAKRVLGKSTASFVNAILRAVDQLGELTLPSEIQNLPRLAVEFSHPEWIVSAYSDALKDESQVKDLLARNNTPASPTLIAWPGLATKHELLECGGQEMSGSAVAVQYDGNPGDIPAVKERRAGVQDLGSQIMVELFFKTHLPNLRWLDLCAGPGGKAAYLSALLAQGGGEFVANEISSQRAKLVSQVVKYGQVTNFDGREIPTDLGRFDRIMVDAPCTGIGALRRRPEVRWRRSLQDLKNLVSLQRELLDSAARNLNPGGVLAYVTCSPHQAETIFQVRGFLKDNPAFKLIGVDDSRVNPDGTLQLWTHKDGTDAMFMALLRKDN